MPQQQQLCLAMTPHQAAGKTRPTQDNTMPRTSPQALQQQHLAENDTALTLALHGLHEALRRLNDHVHGMPAHARDDTLLAAMADSNRALAQALRLASERDLFLSARCFLCTRCLGDGKLTQRGLLLKRIPCPDCDATGFCVAIPPPAQTPVLPRGHRQRRILTRLLALGGASWPVPLKRLWIVRQPSPADRAALSRSLRLLEEQGLLHRSHAQQPSPRSRVPRASQVMLTSTGAAFAQTLTMTGKR
jgi:hypothetical protein